MTDDPPGIWVKSPRDDLMTTHPNLREFMPFLDVLNSESPRGGVLVATSFIESLLHKVIEAFLIEGKPAEQLVKGFNAPIGSLSAKIAMAAALGLITERERRECDLIRRVRNKFAHNVHPTFDDDDVKDICQELTFRAMPYGDVKVGARGSFTSAAVALVLNLTNRPHYVAKARLKPVDWPY